jgi:hypothetical protein
LFSFFAGFFAVELAAGFFLTAAAGWIIPATVASASAAACDAKNTRMNYRWRTKHAEYANANFAAMFNK